MLKGRILQQIMCDNFQTLAALTAYEEADLRDVNRINHAYAHIARKPPMKVSKKNRQAIAPCAQTSALTPILLNL